jgi:hypothetical protein
MSKEVMESSIKIIEPKPLVYTSKNLEETFNVVAKRNWLKEFRVIKKHCVV